MDVGRERSTWGEYLHSLTVRVSMIFNLPFSHVVSLTTPTLCEVWKSAAIHSISPTLQLVSGIRLPSQPHKKNKKTVHGIIRHRKLDNTSMAVVTLLLTCLRRTPLDKAWSGLLLEEKKKHSPKICKVYKADRLQLLPGWKAVRL